MRAILYTLLKRLTFGLFTDAMFCVEFETNIFVSRNFISCYTHPFNGPFSGTTRVSRYQKGKTSLDFTEATDSEWR